MAEINEAIRLELEEHIKKDGHRYARCDIPEFHNGHVWSMEPYPSHDWWCDGLLAKNTTPLSVAEFETAHGRRYRKCSRVGSHQSHNWEIPGLGHLWCADEMPEGWADGKFENKGDHTIRPLPCPTTESHTHHLWEDASAQWSCPGIDGPELNHHAADSSIRIAAYRKKEDDSGSDFHAQIAHYRDGMEDAAVWKNWPERFPDGPSPQETTVTEDKPGTDLAVWADRAMFRAEPIDAQEGPRVYLLWMTPDPLGAIAAACKMYKGEVVRNLRDVTDEERLEYLAQVQNTKLKAPFEFVKFHFMLEGVTRAFTHQMVRQRTAAYAQESLRFAVKEDMPVGLPPSLAGLSDEHPAVLEWEYALAHMQTAYQKLVDEHGIPAEDARGLLPTNILTRLHYTTDLRALLDHAGNRLCTQAQFEWRLVFAQIVDAIRSTAMTIERGSAEGNGQEEVYMADKLTDLFKPVCYQTGKCEFKANFDRACNIRGRVDAFENAGIPSEGWHSDGWVDWEQNPLDGIKPGEWLLDHNAAREK
jgi:flavin-dependent thymidylate synthase